MTVTFCSFYGLATTATLVFLPVIVEVVLELSVSPQRWNKHPNIFTNRTMTSERSFTGSAVCD